MSYTLREVERFPDIIEPEVLYWSKEFEISAHLCACGCGDVIYLPVTPVDYSIVSDKNGPTVLPSIGNWNVCDAHYFITDGDVEWAPAWSQERIARSRVAEDGRRAAFYSPPTQTWRKWIIAKVRKFLRIG